jgi:ABC-2 type transport system permease protein
VVVCGLSLRTAVVTGAVAGTLVGMYVLDLAGRLDKSLDVIRYASVFRYYGNAIQDGIEPLAFFGVTLVAVIVAIAGAIVFERRDLPS